MVEYANFIILPTSTCFKNMTISMLCVCVSLIIFEIKLFICSGSHTFIQHIVECLMCIVCIVLCVRYDVIKK